VADWKIDSTHYGAEDRFDSFIYNRRKLCEEKFQWFVEKVAEITLERMEKKVPVFGNFERIVTLLHQVK
jgi:hypothetical protein